jgi:hypothetical protein
MKFATARLSIITAIFITASASLAGAQQAARRENAAQRRGISQSVAADQPSSDVLTPGEWERVDDAVERALVFLASQQQADGSFPTDGRAQPAVTSLCTLAFLSSGNVPGEGHFGRVLDRASDYILACQKQNGLVTLLGPDGPDIARNVNHGTGVHAAYNHAISSLTLSEMYGMARTQRSNRIQTAINKALAATLQMQRWPKDMPIDRGGWRYIDHGDQSDSDLSVTGWQLMFLRSARNAGFNVPEQAIDEAVGYVRRTFDKDLGTFGYRINRDKERSRGMAGAGILALGHAGFHNSFEAKQTGEWLLQYSFEVYNDDYSNRGGFERERYHYSLFNCCQGMYQLGSPYWERFFPRTARALLEHQQSNGSWDAESRHNDRIYGNSYTTSLVILSLGAGNQLLPIFQR